MNLGALTRILLRLVDELAGSTDFNLLLPLIWSVLVTSVAAAARKQKYARMWKTFKCKLSFKSGILKAFIMGIVQFSSHKKDETKTLNASYYIESAYYICTLIRTESHLTEYVVV